MLLVIEAEVDCSTKQNIIVTDEDCGGGFGDEPV